MKKLVKTLKINKLLIWGLRGKIEIERKTCQNAENKQTFGLNGKIEIDGIKTRQNAENKQTLTDGPRTPSYFRENFFQSFKLNEIIEQSI